MIGCHVTRQGIQYPLSDYCRQRDSRLPMLWYQSGFEPVGQSMALMRIEKFVDKVVSSDKPAFRLKQDKSGMWVATETAVGRELMDTLPLLGLFDSQHDYSEKPYAFLDACWAIQTWWRLDLQVLGANPAMARLNHPGAMNSLVDKIRMSSRMDWFVRGRIDRRYWSKLRAQKVAGYVATRLHRYSKLLLIRVDFSYSKESRLTMTIDRLYQDFYRYLGLRYKHACFNHLVGYVWAIEEGTEKGPHAHALFILDGSKVREDISLGWTMHDLWVDDITGGAGSSRNCNAFKDEYDDIGIGMIERADVDACEKAVKFATYLAKDPHHPDVEEPQYLRMKPAGFDAFGTGQDYAADARSGRPPIHPTPWAIEDMRHIRWPGSPR